MFRSTVLQLIAVWCPEKGSYLPDPSLIYWSDWMESALPSFEHYIFRATLTNRYICLKSLKNIDVQPRGEETFVSVGLPVCACDVWCQIREEAVEEGLEISCVIPATFKLLLKCHLSRCSVEPFTSPYGKQPVLVSTHYLIILFNFLYDTSISWNLCSFVFFSIFLSLSIKI